MLFTNKRGQGQEKTAPQKNDDSSDLGLPVVRPMTEADLPQVMAIENQSFPNPWKLTSFQSELRENTLAYYNCLVFQGKVIGYMGYWAIYGEAHVTNVAIHPDHRRAGWGEYLFRTVINQCIQSKIQRMTLEVRVSNNAAQSLYTKLGFRGVGVRNKYYVDNQEDALVMWVSL